MHGFVLTDPMGRKSHWQSIDDPNGAGSTMVNGINTAGDLVGFYTDAAETPTACSPPRNPSRNAPSERPNNREGGRPVRPAALVPLTRRIWNASPPRSWPGSSATTANGRGPARR